MHIGIDVGGTNTDAVLMAGDRVLATIKTATTQDVTTGIRDALDGLAEAHPFAPGDIDVVAIGTTHFTNAVIQASGLAATAVVRLGLPAAAGIPPLTGWPARLRSAIGEHVHLCHGGHEFDGREISPLDPDELKRVAEDIVACGVDSVAITSIFSPVNQEMELAAAEILRAQVPWLRISLSHEVGRVGLLERENATIVNASLLPVADRITGAFHAALVKVGIEAPLYLSQNDGTLMDAEYVRRYPVATFAAGPTNSMRGAALLSGLSDCVVVDIGGTTTDVGAVVGGFPRPATTEVDIGGVRTNFRMPDVVSIGIGGGSRVVLGEESVVGPESVGLRLHTEGLVFGGSTLTATDVAVAGGLADIGDPALVAHLDRARVRRCLDAIARRVGVLADTMRTSAEPIPMVLVGGGSVLLPDSVPGFDKVVRPENYAVANAIGAAIAQVGGEVDRVFSAADGSRVDILDKAKDEALRKAVLAGADEDTVRVVEVEELPMAYLPGDAVRVRVKAVGDLVLGGTR
ncbi:hydantoinase/oxoprolinase family protein [Actinokineospora sp. UTMC 2448]|uniref:hydantoinase/oxoprolinase family protein n=1 Tax=Actinokineospora sp. UTMC 2448 TaxID=2268449 RepID=UPI002164BC3C|nr:hydantoinase/oxoprolinase family protein [Actinokineospora sp. UTMC 2448]UVS79566.1 Acetophenone carboxylase gamma subunit [Actinokineospora sp. UTMC 2448]